MSSLKLTKFNNWIILNGSCPSGLSTKLKEFIKPASWRIYDYDASKWQVYYKAFPMLHSICSNYYDSIDYQDLPVTWTENLITTFKTPTNSYSTLHLLPNAPPQVVKAAYKALATIHHPDKGGDAFLMIKINEAYSDLSKKLDIK